MTRSEENLIGIYVVENFKKRNEITCHQPGWVLTLRVIRNHSSIVKERNLTRDPLMCVDTTTVEFQISRC